MQVPSITANILDPIQSRLPEIWDDPTSDKPTLKPRYAHFIKKSVYAAFERNGYDHPEDWCELYLSGSLTTYQYSPESDVDVNIFINSSKLPEWSRAEMVGIMVSEVDGTRLPGTTYPLQVFVMPHGVKPADKYQAHIRSGYDIDNGRWIEPPDRKRVMDVEKEENAWYVQGLEAADKMESLLRYEPAKAIQYYNQIHQRRQRDSVKGDFGPANIIYKFLERRGLLNKVQQLMHTSAADSFVEADPDQWMSAFDRFYQDVDPQKRPYVTKPSLDELQNRQRYLDRSGNGGYTITPEGEIANVFNHPTLGERGLAQRAIPHALERGGYWLNAFDDPNLTQNYQGFTPQARIPFDPEFGPEGWQTHPYLQNQPDIVFMTHGVPQNEDQSYAPSWDDAVQKAQNAVRQPVFSAMKTSVTTPWGQDWDEWEAIRPNWDQGEGHKLGYDPSIHNEGKGFILNNGDVWTWPTDDMRPRHMDMSGRAKYISDVKPGSAFHIRTMGPTRGQIWQYGEGRALSKEDQTNIRNADSRLDPWSWYNQGNQVPAVQTDSYGHADKLLTMAHISEQHTAAFGLNPDELIPEQQEFFRNLNQYRNDDKDNDVPLLRDFPAGLRVWRGERDPYGDPTGRDSVGRHWTIHPSVAHEFANGGKDHAIIWQGTLDKPSQVWPREHHIWDQDHTMNNEYEIRMRPGSHVNIEGYWRPTELNNWGGFHKFWPYQNFPENLYEQTGISEPKGWEFVPIGTVLPATHEFGNYKTPSDWKTPDQLWEENNPSSDEIDYSGDMWDFKKQMQEGNPWGIGYSGPKSTWWSPQKYQEELKNYLQSISPQVTQNVYDYDYDLPTSLQEAIGYKKYPKQFTQFGWPEHTPYGGVNFPVKQYADLARQYLDPNEYQIENQRDKYRDNIIDSMMPHMTQPPGGWGDDPEGYQREYEQAKLKAISENPVPDLLQGHFDPDPEGYHDMIDRHMQDEVIPTFQYERNNYLYGIGHDLGNRLYYNYHQNTEGQEVSDDDVDREIEDQLGRVLDNTAYLHPSIRPWYQRPTGEENDWGDPIYDKTLRPEDREVVMQHALDTLQSQRQLAEQRKAQEEERQRRLQEEEQARQQQSSQFNVGDIVDGVKNPGIKYKVLNVHPTGHLDVTPTSGGITFNRVHPSLFAPIQQSQPQGFQVGNLLTAGGNNIYRVINVHPNGYVDVQDENTGDVFYEQNPHPFKLHELDEGYQTNQQQNYNWQPITNQQQNYNWQPITSKELTNEYYEEVGAKWLY